MNDIIIGCPTANRTWILPLWKEYVDAAIPVDWNAKFIFTVPEWDTDTTELISTWENAQIIPSVEPERPDYRDWANRDAYNRMVELRNSILRYVRGHHPDIYLSLDSDILIQKDVISNMIDTMTTFKANAVGGMTYLDPVDDLCTNVAAWADPLTKKGFRRLTFQGTYPVDVIMAIQMMDNLAYNVDYEYHDMGEDFGWCVGLNRAGASIYFDGREKSKHVMSPEWLEIVDSRVGY